MLIKQPTSAPTRKMAAVAASGAIGTVVITALSGFVTSHIPDLSASCANEVSLWAVAGGSATLISVVNFVAGYFRRAEAGHGDA